MFKKKLILDNFYKLIQKAKSSDDKRSIFKIRHYNKVIKIIKSQDKQELELYTLENYKSLLQQNGIKNPKKILDKIRQLIETGNLDELLSYQADPKIAAIKELTSIYAVGPSKAKELYSKGIHNINELREKLLESPNLINNKQKLGLKYYNDLAKRIPRKEIDDYNILFQKICQNMNILSTIAGSYRRGAKDSGDIDLLITSEKHQHKALKMLVDKLKQLGIIKEVLANGKKKFMGITILENTSGLGGFYPYRHLDIVYTNIEEYPFAMLYFTGSGPFNVNMRKRATDLGYSLNEHNITYKQTKVKLETKTILDKIGKLTIKTESDIFKLLKMEYKNPEDRN